MGGAISNPVDESTKKEIEDLIKAMLKTFTVQYIKWYAIYLVKKIKRDAMIPPSPYKLLERPESTDHVKCGYLLKEGAIRKNWKKRFFVARYDFVVDYYESDAISKKAKGSMSLNGYRVIEDPNDGIIKRLTTLAEKMGINMSEIPKPKEYPKLTFELHHDRRRCYFVKCETEEEFKEWVDVFKTCCRRAYGLKNRDHVHQKAFHEAIRRTRWELDRWGWWEYGGSEEQILSDMISDQIDWAVMGRIYSKIQGAWTIRNAVRNQVLKTLDTIISTGVAPAWKAMSTAVEELRPKIEPTIKELVDPIGKAEAELTDKVKDAALSVITPALEQHVNPHLSKIMTIIQSPMTEAYTESYRMFEEQLGKFELPGTKEALVKSFYPLDRFYSSWEMYGACSKVDILYDPLWALREIFSEIYPWSLIWKGHDTIRHLMDNAMYTYQQRILKAVEENETALADPKALSERIKAEVLADYKFDGTFATIEWYSTVLRDIVYPPFNAVVIPAAKVIISPIGDAIPEPMKQFLDVEQMFTDLIYGIVDGCIQSVVGSGQKSE